MKDEIFNTLIARFGASWKRGLLYVPYKSHTEFLEIRDVISNRFGMPGSSDTGTILRLSEYQDINSLLLQKIGFITKQWFDNFPMYLGRLMEETGIAVQKYYVYLDPEDPIISKKDKEAKNNFLERVNRNEKLLKARKINAIIINPDYWWMASSLDYECLKPTGVLELKIQQGFVIEKYLNGLPPTYIAQLQQQMLVSKRDRGELLQIVDAVPLLTPFPVFDAWRDDIISKTEEFFHRVQAGKQIYQAMSIRNASVDEIESELSSLYYPEDGSNAYEDFLKEQHRQENKKITIDGDFELMDEYCKAFKLKDEAEALKKDADTIFQKVKMHMVDVGADKIDFGDGFRLTYKGNGLRPSSDLKQYIKFGQNEKVD